MMTISGERRREMERMRAFLVPDLLSEMGSHHDETPDEVFSTGQEVNVEVVYVDSKRQRMSLRLLD